MSLFVSLTAARAVSQAGSGKRSNSLFTAAHLPPGTKFSSSYNERPHMSLTSLFRRPVRQGLGLLSLDLVFFGLTNPAEAPAALVIVGFILLSLTLYCLIYCLTGLARLYGLSVRRHSLARSLTLIVSLLVALQSVGGLSGRDILVLIPFALLGYLYNVYAGSSRRNLEG